MAVPKKRTSKSKKKIRQIQWKKSAYTWKQKALITARQVMNNFNTK